MYKYKGFLNLLPPAVILIDWLIDWTVVYAASAIFQQYNGGVVSQPIGILVCYILTFRDLNVVTQRIIFIQ